MSAPAGFGAATAGLHVVEAAAGLPRHVRKVLSPAAGNVLGIGPGIGLDQGDCHYWARERDFYRAVAAGGDPLGAAGTALRPPRVLDLRDRPDGSAVLALEYVPDAGGDGPDHYRRLALHLGAFNGAALRRPAADPQAWLSRGWLRWWFGATVPATVAGLRRLPADARAELARVVDPDRAVARATAVWRARAALLDALDRAPLTLSHLDAHRRNLLTAPSGQVVAIDWSYVGFEALGADAAQLFASSAARTLIPGGALDEYRAAVLDGYLAGLRGAGVPPDLCDRVPHCFDLAVCARWGATQLFWARHLTDPAARRALELRWWARPYRDAAPDLAHLDRFLARLDLTALTGGLP
ncbi:hypothetical protein AB0K51_04480 [Kitasatospora sp. NPDC049285]|uniref:hypothetical protein n=1 Tax=Kitasatospora sp. NPDC049285 TaxID=3157096 RepID=UPI00342D6E39